MTRNNSIVTRSGRVTQAPRLFTFQKMGQALTETELFSADEINYYRALCIGSMFGLEELELEDTQDGYQADELVTRKLGEVAGVGVAVGGGFNNTAELKPMNYKEAMKCSDK